MRQFQREDTLLERLAHVGGSLWRIASARLKTSDVGLDGYNTPTAYQAQGRLCAGWHHHITMCLLAWTFLLPLLRNLRE